MEAFAAQGRRDWETILLHRARELVPGGRLVVANFCKDEAGRYNGNTGRLNRFDTFAAIWRRFAAEGMIQPEEYVRMTLPQYYRTVEEYTEPLLDPSSSVYRAGLRVEHWETRIVPCPFIAEFHQHGDAARFARDLTPSLRSWTESTFVAALSPERSPEARQDIIERYYSTYEALVREDPMGYQDEKVNVYMTIAKTGA